MPDRRLLAIVPAALAVGLAAPAAAQESGLEPGVSKIRTDGIGPVMVGMTVEEAREAAGIRLFRQEVGECVYLTATPRKPDGPTLRFHGGTLHYVSVARKGYATVRGISVGDRLRKVKRQYKRLHRRENLGGGFDYVWRRGTGRLIFSVAQGRVYRISGGRAPKVMWQECV